jgi:hypothetical protein
MAEDQTNMKTTLVALLLSLVLTGCVVAPGGYGGGGGWYGDRGRGNDGHGDFHAGQEQYHEWGR